MANKVTDPRWKGTEMDERYFRTVYENLPVGVVVLTTEGKIARMNARNAEIFGIKDLDESNGYCVFDDVNIDPNDRRKMLQQDDYTYYYNLQPWNLKGFGNCTLPETKFLFCRFRKVYTQQHEHVGYILVNIDLTDQHEKLRAEANLLSKQLQQIHYSSKMMTWTWDIPTGRIRANRTFAPVSLQHILHGMSEISATELLALVCPDDRGVFLGKYEKMMHGDKDTEEMEVRIKFKGTDLPYTWVRFCGMISEYDKSGLPKTMIGSTTIIEESKRMQEELRQAKEKAERSDHMKTAFIDQINHEIRTPLNIILGFSEFLAKSSRGMSEEELEGVVNDIRKSGHAMMDIVNNTLHLSQLNNGILEKKEVSCSGYDLLYRVQQKYCDQTHEGVELILDSSLEHECMVMTDPKLLNIVLDNLVSNAVKFTYSGTVTLACKFVGDQVEFSVSDTGPGLPELEESVFHLFTKGDSYTPGMGIGLSLCKSMIRFLGSQIKTNTEQGVGTTFSFLINKG